MRAISHGADGSSTFLLQAWLASWCWLHGLCAMHDRSKFSSRFQRTAMNSSSMPIAIPPTAENSLAFGPSPAKKICDLKALTPPVTKHKNLSFGAVKVLTTPPNTSPNYPKLLPPESVANGSCSAHGKTPSSLPLRDAIEMLLAPDC